MRNIFKPSLAIIAGIFLFLQGCKKDNQADNVAFVGTYNGTDALDIFSGGPTYYGNIRILASGVNANQITIVDSIYQVTFSALVKGNSISSISGSTLALGNFCSNETFTGNGTLNSGVLTYSLYGTYFCNGTNNYDTLQFYGSRL